MNLLNVAWHWYTTVETSGYWVTRYDGALAAIASVAVVVWTGGLIAYQLKVPDVSRTIALSFLQNAFMLAVLAFFPHALTIRIAMTVLIVYYAYDNIRTLLLFGNPEYLMRDRDKYPLLTEEYWRKQAQGYRLLGYVNLFSVAVFYGWLLIWPYPIAFLWACAMLLFLGLQSVLIVLNNTPDDWRTQAAIANQQTLIKGQTITNEILLEVGRRLDSILKQLTPKP